MAGNRKWLPATLPPLWLVPVVVAPLALSAPFLFGQVLLFRDGLQFAAPIWSLAASAIDSGRLPQWNPLIYGGTPLLAELDAGVFYPARAVFLALPPATAATAFALLHLPVAGFGAYWLTRTLGGSRISATIAGTGFVTSGYLLSLHGGDLYFAGAAILPVATTLLLRTAEVPSRRRAVPAAVLVALLVFNGELQAAIFAGLLSLSLALARDCSARARLGGAACVLAALLGGAALAAVQLLPTLTFAGSTTRAHGLSLDDAATWSLAPARWIEFLVPQPFGISYPENGYWGATLLDPPHLLPWAPSLYLGPLFVVLGVTGWKGGARRERVLAALGGMALLLAAGKALPFFGWWHLLVPLANRFRYPEKFALVATLVLVLLAALSLDGPPMPRRRRVLFGIAAVMAVAAGLASTRPAWLVAWIAHGLVVGSATATPEEAAGTLALALARTAALAAAFGLVLRLRTARVSLGNTLLIALVLIDGVTGGSAALSFGSGGFLREPPPVVAQLRSAMPAGSTNRFWPDRSCRYPGGEGEGTLLERVRAWEWSTGKENFLEMFALADIVGYGAAESPEKIAIFQAVGRTDPLKAARLFGAAVRLGCTPDGRSVVSPIDNPLPRAFVTSARRVPSSELLRELQDPRFDPGRVALLEGPPSDAPADGLVQRATIERDDPEAVDVRTGGAAGTLILTDSFAPGWTAAIDGASAEIYRVDGLWRGVELPAGAHRVTFRYQTPWLLAGAITSSAAAIVGAALFAF